MQEAEHPAACQEHAAPANQDQRIRISVTGWEGWILESLKVPCRIILNFFFFLERKSRMLCNGSTEDL